MKPAPLRKVRRLAQGEAFRQPQVQIGLDMIDVPQHALGVGAAVEQAETLVTLGLATGKRGAYAFPARKTYTARSPGFAAKGGRVTAD